jgi:hypothetical protein
LTDATSDERSSTGEDDVGAIGVDEPAVSVPLGSVDNPLLLSSSSYEDLIPGGQRPRSERGFKPETAALLSELFSDSSFDDTIVEPDPLYKSPSSGPSTLPCHGAVQKKKKINKQNKTDNVCCPKGFVPSKTNARKSRSTAKNPYTKNNYLVWSSSDDDFQ